MPSENGKIELRDFVEGLVAEFASNKEAFIQSVNEDNLSLLRATHDLVHSFMSTAVPKITTDTHYLSRTAFLLCHSEVFDLAHLAFYEAFSANYAAARMLLRSTLELLLKGTLWECLAHERYRGSAAILEEKPAKIGPRRVSIIDWLHDVINAAPDLQDKMEKNSSAVLDVILPLYEERELRRIIPSARTIIEQLAAWNLLGPAQGRATPQSIYDLYRQLSDDVHVAPASTDIGRRVLADKESLFVKSSIIEELNSFCGLLQRVMAIGVAIQESILPLE